MIYKIKGTWVWHHDFRWVWFGYTWRPGIKHIRIGRLVIRFQKHPEFKWVLWAEPIKKAVWRKEE